MAFEGKYRWWDPLPGSEDGLKKFARPEYSAARKAAALKEAADASGAEAKNIVLKLHLRRGHARGNQLKLIPFSAGGGNGRLLARVDEVRL